MCGEHHHEDVSCGGDVDLPPRVRGAPLGASGRPTQSRLTPACAGSTRTWPAAAITVATYPRVCGEHANSAPTSSLNTDLPPRVRGARRPRRGAVDQHRLTPACAGSTSASACSFSLKATYPRVCGEHSSWGAVPVWSIDLPPRVRGAPGAVDGVDGVLRLTPACAGSTTKRWASRRRGSTYPRVCGEHDEASSDYSIVFDLPPRVRGAPLIGEAGPEVLRLTPACAGSTGRSSRWSCVHPTYPRVCGEHGRRGRVTRPRSDLPPRVRGALPDDGGTHHRARLTPACAGSTTFAVRWQQTRSTYPRVCGEHSDRLEIEAGWDDLRPRVRGALSRRQRRQVPDRLTPACAGSTRHGAGADRLCSTYPRVCGEHRRTTGRPRTTTDLPPRVRGALFPVEHQPARRRLTPACAGSTLLDGGVCLSMSTYPRVCGEHVTARRYACTRDDLPPRVRGAPRYCHQPIVRHRLTPACAGSTSRLRRCPGCETTYPRVCGEHRAMEPGQQGWFDLPPRVRGARAVSWRTVGLRRLTPACAGSTAMAARSPPPNPTYPRVCGEHAACSATPTCTFDLPPRVRGAPPLPDTAERRRRLTPACAGSTPVRELESSLDSTYPRVCGEHCCSVLRWPVRFDLPPRVRGAPPAYARSYWPGRLTPACAGSTAAHGVLTVSAPTYPRVCGEHEAVCCSMAVTSDLPPRVRGALGANHVVREQLRLTPACAGSTSRTRCRTGSTPTYPRVCGEHGGLDLWVKTDADLPPRVRGAPQQRLSAHRQARLTPACAGSTNRLPARGSLDTTYPRVCGEHYAGDGCNAVDSDLPPRVRGAPGGGHIHIDDGRLTPACAGSTATTTSKTRLAPTYTRVCGEHESPRRSLSLADDLPPRVRGAHRCCQ